MARCAAGGQVVTFYYGMAAGIESIECEVRADSSTHRLPDFIILAYFRPEMLVNVIGSVRNSTLLHDVEGDFDISSDFSVYADSESDFKTIVSPDMNVKLRQLKGLYRNNSLIVSCYQNTLRVIKPSSCKTSVSTLSEFVSLSSNFVSAIFECVGSPLRLAPVRSARLLSASRSRPGTKNMGFSHDTEEMNPVSGKDFTLIESNDPAEDYSRCQICGSEIEHEYVTCMKCDTPYHRDCWEYNGQCAIFGCMCQNYKEGEDR